MSSKVVRYLPQNGWMELQDAQGRTYFANFNTKETRWDPPPENSTSNSNAAGVSNNNNNANNTVAPPTSLPANTQSPPSASVATAAPSNTTSTAQPTASKSGTSEWREIVDEKTGKTYYYNRITKETRWDRPDGSGGIGDNAKIQTSTGQVLTRYGGPGSNWVKAPDPKSGQEYFVNLVTKETRWDPPPDVSLPPGSADALSPRKDNVDTGAGVGGLASSSIANPSVSTQVVNGVVQAGVGIFLEQREVGSPMFVKTIFKDSAADRCGKLQVGDELVSVNGERIAGRTPTSLRTVIMGPQGSYCRCGFRRGNAEFEIKLLRGTGESLSALAMRGLELHEELDSVRESLRLVEAELEEERRKRLAESNLRSEIDNLDRTGWKEERKKLLDQLELEQRARKESEARERRLLDERVQDAIHEKERASATDNLNNERLRVEQLLQLERQRAADAENIVRTKSEEIQRLQEQLRVITDRSQDFALRNTLKQAEEREQGLLRALEQERLRYEEQLKKEQETRVSEQGRRMASEEREQQLLRQLEDERFRWGEALRLEEQRAKMAESAKREEIIRDIQEREEKLRQQSMSSSQQRFEDERSRLEAALTTERARSAAAIEREQKLIDELRKRGEDERQRGEEIAGMRKALNDDRNRLEAAIIELNERLNVEKDKRENSERREATLVEQLRTLRRNASDPIVRQEIDDIKAQLNLRSSLANLPPPPPPSILTNDIYNASSTARSLRPNENGSSNSSSNHNNNILNNNNINNLHTDIRDEIAREKEKLGIDRLTSRLSVASSSGPQPTGPISSHSVPNLVGLLTSKNTTTVRESAYSLGLVAVEPDGRSSILALPQAVFRLENLLSSPDAGTVRYSALALGNLAMDGPGRKAVLNIKNSVEHLAGLLRSDDIETVRYAALALGNLVLEESGRKAVLAYPAAVPHLAAQLTSSDKQTVRYATGAIRNVAVEENGRRAVSASAATLQALSLLQTSADSATARYATAALKNLAISQ